MSAQERSSNSIAAIRYDDDCLSPAPDQAFDPPAGIYPGSDQLLSRAGMDERGTAA